MKFKNLIFATATIATMAASNASAATWSLFDAVFTDGSTLTGSFDWDGASYSNVVLELTAAVGATYPSTSFGFASNFSTSSALNAFTSPGIDGDPALQLGFVGGLVASGGTVNVSPFSNLFTCVTFAVSGECVSAAGPQVFMQGSKPFVSTAAVPIPASFPLLMAGLGGLALLRRRRKAS